jgi:RNA polymerase sigma-70 factor (ECF subfamily)
MEYSSPYIEDAKRDVCEFEALVKRYHRQAYNIAYRFAGNHADAEDIVQEAFLRAYRFFDRYNRDMPFENWLYRIISNVYIDEIRKRPKVRMQSLDQPLTSQGEETDIRLEVPDPAGDASSQMMHSALDERIQTALDSLPAEFKRSVILADIEGLSYEEIAEIMGCSLGTVRSRLHRGRKLLRNRLQPFMEMNSGRL